MRKIARTFTPVNRSSDRLLIRPDRLLTKRNLPQSATRSQLLADANARLMALRGQRVPTKTEANSSAKSSDLTFPAHLGWGNDRVLHPVGQQDKVETLEGFSAENPPLQAPRTLNIPASPHANQAKTHIAIHPRLAAAFLKHEVATSARIWLLLRQIDVRGCGWVTIDSAKQLLTEKNTALRVCGWRQLRNLLRAGNSIFWHRDKERIWLRSVANVASQLEVHQLNRPITLPTTTLLANIKTVRANFYAISHSQRKSPISRAKLADITGVSERTQRRYDQVAQIQKTANYCLELPSDDPQNAAWHQRHAAFDFIDKHGRYGPAGKQYRAFQLPNSYTISYQTAAKGRTRKINQQLRQDLVKHRAQGNGRSQIDEQRVFGRKLFFDNGRAASIQNGDSYLKTQGNIRRAFWTYLG